MLPPGSLHVLCELYIAVISPRLAHIITTQQHHMEPCLIAPQHIGVADLMPGHVQADWMPCKVAEASSGSLWPGSSSMDPGMHRAARFQLSYTGCKAQSDLTCPARVPVMVLFWPLASKAIPNMMRAPSLPTA